MRGESGARVHEHADKHRSDGKRNDVNAQQAVFHKERHHNGIERYHHVKHHHRARFLQILRAEHHQETRKEPQQQQHINELADDGVLYLALRHVAACHFLLHRGQHAIGLFVHNLAPVYYLLSRKHHAACQRHGCQQVVQLGCAAFLIVSHVHMQVTNDVGLLQSRAVCRQHIIVEQLLVGLHGAVNAAHLHALHTLTYNYAHHAARIFGNAVVLWRADDAGLVKSVQPVVKCAHLRHGHPWYSFWEIGLQLGQLPFLHAPVVMVVGLEQRQQRVALLLYHLVALINGKVELGDERPIHPRLAHIVTHLRRIVARQKPYDDQQRNKYEAAQRQYAVQGPPFGYNGFVHVFTSL